MWRLGFVDEKKKKNLGVLKRPPVPIYMYIYIYIHIYMYTYIYINL
jgi:hypothetical protein